MGQQQMLLIILGVIIVGIALVVGIDMFGASAAMANLEAVSNDLLHLAALSQQYFVKSVQMGGGGYSFTNLTNISQLLAKATNDNGTYSVLSQADDNVTLQGVGVLDGDDDGTLITVQIKVFADSLATTIISQ